MPPQQVFLIFLRNEKSFFCKLNFYLYTHPWDICPWKSFSDRTYRLGSKIRQTEDAGGGGGNHHLPSQVEQKLTYFSNHEDDIQS